MNISSYLVILFIAWLIFFFIFLPIGIKVPDNHEKGHANSSPEKANVPIKLLFSFMSALVVSIIYYLINKVYF